MTDITKDERERALADARRVVGDNLGLWPEGMARVLLSEAKRAEELLEVLQVCQ